MKTIIIKSDDNRLSSELITDLLDNEVDLSATGNEYKSLDDEQLEELAVTCYEPIMPINDWIDAFKVGYRKKEEDLQ